MVDFRTKKLENLVNQLNNQTIRIGSKTGQEVKLSIFNKEIEITEQNKDFLSFFNTQKDNKIDSEELAVLKKVLVDYAREDKILTKEEFLEIFGKKPNSPDGEKLFTDFQKFVTSQSKVSKSPITEGEKDENVTEDFNADGSGTRITKKKDKLGNDVIITEEFGAGKILTKKTINGKNTIVEQEYKNNAQGKPVQIVTTNKMSSGNIIQSNIVELKYDDKGNIIEKNTTFKNDKNQIISVSQETMKYNDQNKISEKKTIQKKGNKITKNTVETITYNSQGKVQSKKITAYDNNNKIIATNNVQFEYDTNGKLKKSTEKIQEKVTINNQTKIENKNIVTTYNEQGKISHRTTSKPQIKLQNGRLINTTQTVEEDFKYRENGTLLSTSKDFLDNVGKPYHTESHYAEDGMREISCDKTFYKRGVIIKQRYEGPNLDNRKKGGLPSTSIEYETDGRTVKQKIVNEFDSEGIFIGQKIYDKNDKLTASYDFSKIDGTFEIARQVARGDCYLMATINSFASTPDGQNILKNNVSITTDANGKKVYTIKLPGSKIAREALINGSGNINVGKLPADKVFIQESYTITEDELHTAMLQSGSKYSAGDKDVLLYEVAFEKYRNDLKKTIDTNHIQQNHIAGLFVDSKNGDNLSGGLGFEPMFIISGKKADSYINKDSNSAPVCYVDSNYQLHLPDEDGQINTKAITMTNASNNERKRNELLNKLEQDSKDGKIDQYVVTVGIKVSQQEINGEVINGGGHEFTVLKVTKDQVVLTNPWSPETPVVMSRADFDKAVTAIFVLPIDRATSPAQPNPNPTNPANPTGTVTPTNPANPSSQNNRPNYTVPRGQSYTQMIIIALKQQGIEPTKENIRKAKAQFEACNKGAVHIYRGRRKKWHGNKFLYANAQVFIPQFKI